MKNRPHFRFEDLEIWQRAKRLAVGFHRVADKLEHERLYRNAEQLHAAGWSLSNTLALGAGSTSKPVFRQFLNIARRSLFEDASMLLVFESLAVIDTKDAVELLIERDFLSR